MSHNRIKEIIPTEIEFKKFLDFMRSQKIAKYKLSFMKRKYSKEEMKKIFETYVPNIDDFMSFVNQKSYYDNEVAKDENILEKTYIYKMINCSSSRRNKPTVQISELLYAFVEENNLQIRMGLEEAMLYKKVLLFYQFIEELFNDIPDVKIKYLKIPSEDLIKEIEKIPENKLEIILKKLDLEDEKEYDLNIGEIVRKFLDSLDDCHLKNIYLHQKYILNFKHWYWEVLDNLRLLSDEELRIIEKKCYNKKVKKSKYIDNVFKYKTLLTFDFHCGNLIKRDEKIDKLEEYFENIIMNNGIHYFTYISEIISDLNDDIWKIFCILIFLNVSSSEEIPISIHKILNLE